MSQSCVIFGFFFGCCEFSKLRRDDVQSTCNKLFFSDTFFSFLYFIVRIEHVYGRAVKGMDAARWWPVGVRLSPFRIPSKKAVSALFTVATDLQTERDSLIDSRESNPLFDTSEAIRYLEWCSRRINPPSAQ